jgi:hypothetical protein
MIGVAVGDPPFQWNNRGEEEGSNLVEYSRQLYMSIEVRTQFISLGPVHLVNTYQFLLDYFTNIFSEIFQRSKSWKFNYETGFSIPYAHLLSRVPYWVCWDDEGY